MSTTSTSPQSGPSLRGQLIILVAALGIPLLALQGWWSLHDFRSARERAEQDALAFADATALGVVQFFGAAEEMMTAKASNAPSMVDDPLACASEVEDVAMYFPFLDNAMFVDVTGQVRCMSRPEYPGNASAPGWPWWSGNETPVFTLADPAWSPFADTWILPLVAPVTGADGAPQGALVGTVALERLSELFGGVTIPDDHLVTVATRDRVVISRSEEAELRVGTRLPELSETDELVAPGRWVASGPDFNGIPRTWGQVEIDPGWIVYVGVPDDNVYGPARAESLRHVLSTLLVLLLGVGFAGRYYLKIAGALRELADRTRALAGGEVVALPEGTPLEVRAVVDQFNTTLEGRDRAETSERRTKSRFQSLFDNAEVGLYVSTPEGRFLQANRAFSEMLGFDSPETLLDVNVASLYPNARVRDEMVSKALASGRVPTSEIDWLRADGAPITVRLSGALLERESGPVLEMIAQDITAERYTEEQLRQTQKMDAIGQLAGGIAHDFNNILTVIGGNVELLEDDLPKDDPLREDLQQISKATSRATSLTRRLLAFSRRDRRNDQVIDVTEVISELERLLVPLIGESYELVTEIGPGPLPVAVDLGDFEQVLVNLVLNARDAMQRGGTVTIAAHREKVENPEVGFTEGVALVVTDTGSGMGESVQERIFEPFYTTKPMGHGTGLGLSTVYGIVQRSGGKISVQSEIGRGTRMHICFPLVTGATTVREPEMGEGPGGDERILVVEDDTLVRRFVARALEAAGYTIEVAEDGNAAMDRLRLSDEPFDLILTDVVMPGLTGPELAERLALTAPDTPVLFMSGYLDNSVLSKALRYDPDALLRKPFTATILRHRVRDELDRVRRPATSD